MTRRRILLARTAACAAAAVLLVACSTSPATGPGKTVTVTRSQPPATTGPSTTSTAGTVSPSPTTTSVMKKLPGTCDDLLPLSAIEDAIGHAVPGQTAFVVGKPEKDIGRLAYLNCRYGMPGGPAQANATPAIEIGVSLYGSDAEAAKRIPDTVDDYVNHGATQSDVSADGTPATVLTGGEGAGYTDPTVVAASGQRTIAITIVEKSGGAPTKDLTALATLALQRTGG